MNEELLAVGRITRVHGIRGEVGVLPLTEVEGRFAPGTALATDRARTLTVEAARPFREGLLVKFQEVTDRTQAEALRGILLLVPAADAPDLPDGVWWEHQVVGLEVETEAGEPIGTIREVLHHPANDVWVVARDGADALIPAIRDVIIRVDLEAGRATIRAIPGLLEEED